ncbi:D-alanyl-D-alanine carboxypeptidase family protein [Alkalihalobacterium bogoriense]|uniref:D-alanyl-D-alanine carboxypeptidase family protein n=1 Tax=Alkalihalobacterium bogoriense TaxID=246272 RepID=UPI0006862467|nr:D-alanyl-D-alanine carboxypeptidase family protein [Alkalihalobacterium bogoriense]
MIQKTGISFFIIMILVAIAPFSTYANIVEQEFELHSETAILIDANSGKVLYNQESKKQMYPASLTKIVTGIIALEQGNPEDIVTVSKNAREVIGTRVYLLEGEQVPLYKLVQGLMINSGNDAGLAIAEHFDGTEQRFAERMNKFVREVIGVKDTNFTNPHGLFGEEHYTTAYDMAKITQYAMKNKEFRDIVATRELEWKGEGWETTIVNHHRLLGHYDGVTGVKNGYVGQAGFTLVTTASRNNLDLIVVTLNAPTAHRSVQDTIQLLDYGFQHYETKWIAGGTEYKDQFGNKYNLSEDLAVTVPKGEKLTIEISVYGYMRLLTEQNRLVLIKPLERPITSAFTQVKEEHIETESKVELNQGLYESIISTLQQVEKK